MRRGQTSAPVHARPRLHNTLQHTVVDARLILRVAVLRRPTPRVSPEMPPSSCPTLCKTRSHRGRDGARQARTLLAHTGRLRQKVLWYWAAGGQHACVQGLGSAPGVCARRRWPRHCRRRAAPRAPPHSSTTGRCRCRWPGAAAARPAPRVWRAPSVCTVMPPEACVCANHAG